MRELERKAFAMTLAALLALVCLAALHGCGTGQIPKWSDFTDKDKATFLNGIYNQEFDAYKAAVARPGLTDAQKDVLAAKKKVFTEVWPLLKLYTAYAEKGQLVPADLEPEILRLLSKVKGVL